MHNVSAGFLQANLEDHIATLIQQLESASNGHIWFAVDEAQIADRLFTRDLKSALGNG